MTSKPRQRPPQKLPDPVAPLIPLHFHVSQARSIIDGHVHVLPADAAEPIAAIARDSMADASDPPDFLDVHQLAGVSAFVPLRRRPGLERFEACQAPSGDEASDGAAPQPQLGGDRGAGLPLPAQALDENSS